MVEATVVEAERCRNLLLFFTYAVGRPDKATASPTKPVKTTRPMFWRTMYTLAWLI